MALLKDFERNVEAVVEVLEHRRELIQQQFILEDLGTIQKEDVILKTSLIDTLEGREALKENALYNVSLAMSMGLSPGRNSFPEIVMWLNRYMPQFKSQIERQYSNIIDHFNAILSTEKALQAVELMGLQSEMGRLADDLRYCAKMAREELKPAEIERNVEGGQSIIESKEKPWDKDNLDYILLSEAILKFADNKIPMPTISKQIKPDGPIRYMRKGRRCRVNMGDFREFIKQKYPTIGVEGEVAAEFIADIEARKKQAQRKKQRYNS